MATSVPVKFNLITYNTHLFISSIPDAGPVYEDGPRKDAIDHTYLDLVVPYSQSGSIQIAALQEVWDAELAGDIIGSVKKHGSYKTEYCVNKTIALNPPGLILLADDACSFHFSHDFLGYTDYIKDCTIGGDGWDKQDLPVQKGFLATKCDFPCGPGRKAALGLFTTHMPTSYNSHKKSLSCCFSKLAGAVSKYRSRYPDGAVLVLGDLNIASDDHNGEYTAAVTNILLNGTGLVDAATLSGMDPGYTINPATNTLWQYFNPGQSSSAPTRIDYFFYADSADQTMTVAVDSLNVKTDGLTIPAGSSGALNCSDHYPLQAAITVTVQLPD